MTAVVRARLALLVAGLAAAVLLGWPTVSIERGGEWRRVLAGFQIQRETGDFIGASQSLIHFHGLDGRTGKVTFTLAPRIAGETGDVQVSWSGGSTRVNPSTARVAVEIPLGEGRDVEIVLSAAEARNPRPLVLSQLQLTRDLTAGSAVLALLPLAVGWLVFSGLSRATGSGFSLGASLFVVAATSAGVMAAFDPVRAATFPSAVTATLPIVFAIGFAITGIFGRSAISIAIALIGATLSLHIHTVHSGFVYDDRLWSRSWTPAEIASTFVGSEDPLGISGEQYRPIPSITHATDHALWGSSPGAFHAVNMALHALSAYLLFVFLERLRMPRLPAFMGALLLVAHPLAASSVGWISERTDTLADIFILSTLIVFLGEKGTQTLRVLGFALLALWSKETSVMLPALAILAALVGLSVEERRARYATLRALIAFVVLYVAVWISLFPEKAVGRVMATADTLQSSHSGWTTLFGNLFSQLFYPIGFETWRTTQHALPTTAWAFATLALMALTVVGSFIDHERALSWRVAAMGIGFSALVVLPFRGHDAVDVYRLGHTPTLGFAMTIAALTSLITGSSILRTITVAALVIAGFGPIARETSAAWGYPGFQFRMALRFNRENPYFLSGLTSEMKADLERETRVEAHRDAPLTVPFEP